MRSTFYVLILCLCIPIEGCTEHSADTVAEPVEEEALDTKQTGESVDRSKSHKKVSGGPFVDTPNRGNLPHVKSDLPLDALAERLQGPWQLRETGKGYWIGYTEDMYSIASFGEQAIELLLRLIDVTDSDYAKYGAVYTIHLIGIESKVVGRFIEDFKSKKAREALLSLLTKDKFQVLILELLIRDPWVTDVPHLMAILQKGTPNDWAFVKALQRYEMNSPPVHQKLPDDLSSIPCSCNFKSAEEYYRRNAEALTKAAGARVVVESGLLDSDLWGNWQSTEGFHGGGFGSVLNTFTECDYCDLGNKIEYYYENDTVHLCGMETAKKRWLDWYEKNKDK